LLSIQRFTKVQPLEKSGRHLSEPTLGKGTFGLMADEVLKVRVQFQAEAAEYVEERSWSADQRFENMADGSLIMTFKAQSPLEVISWVLSFGARAEILSPSWLRRDMIKAVKLLANVYKI
jgi:proteasome accessory factor B